VGPLLEFRGQCEALEPAFRRRFHEGRLAPDRLNLVGVVSCNLLLSVKMVRQARWLPLWLLLLDAVCAAVLLALRHHRRHTYVQHRPWLIISLGIIHNCVSA